MAPENDESGERLGGVWRVIGVLGVLALTLCPLTWLLAGGGVISQSAFVGVFLGGLVLIGIAYLGDKLQVRVRRLRVPTDAEWDGIEAAEVDDYGLYLRSEPWRQRRAYMLRRASYRCQVCNRTGNLEVHHRDYNRLGKELREDLVVLCGDCHGLFHRSGRMPDRR